MVFLDILVCVILCDFTTILVCNIQYIYFLFHIPACHANKYSLEHLRSDKRKLYTLCVVVTTIQPKLPKFIEA